MALGRKPHLKRNGEDILPQTGGIFAQRISSEV